MFRYDGEGYDDNSDTSLLTQHYYGMLSITAWLYTIHCKNIVKKITWIIQKGQDMTFIHSTSTNQKFRQFRQSLF